MNIPEMLTSTPPTCERFLIERQMENWRDRFIALIQEGKCIEFDRYDMAIIPSEIEKMLDERRYILLILKSNEDQRVLVPGGLVL